MRAVALRLVNWLFQAPTSRARRRSKWWVVDMDPRGFELRTDRLWADCSAFALRVLDIINMVDFLINFLFSDLNRRGSAPHPARDLIPWPMFTGIFDSCVDMVKAFRFYHIKHDLNIRVHETTDKFLRRVIRTRLIKQKQKTGTKFRFCMRSSFSFILAPSKYALVLIQTL